MASSVFLFPSNSVMTGIVTGGNQLQGGTASTISITFTSGLAVQYQPGLSVTAGSFVAGVTYEITSLGTTNFALIGAPANATVGTLFTATGVGSGTGTAVIAIQSCMVNGIGGMPNGTYISGFVSGTPGGTGVYNLDSYVNSPIIPSVASQTFTQGQHFTTLATASAIYSLPVSLRGPLASFVVHQNSADTGSTAASNYIQGSVDGGQNWVALSGGLATTVAAPAATYTSTNQFGFNTYRLQTGVVTGTANIGGAVRAIFQNVQ